MKNSEVLAVEFFRRRFPDKDLRFEVECGYFAEWVQRIETGQPEYYMDNESLAVWKVMNK